MTKVSVAGPKKLLPKVIETLHSVRILHFVDQKTQDFFKTGLPLASASELALQLVKTRTTMTQLGTSKTKAAKTPADSSALKRLATVETQAAQAAGALRTAEAKKQELAALRKALEPLAATGVDLRLFKEYSSLCTFKGLAKTDFEQDLKKTTKKYELFKARFGQDLAFALFVEKPAEQKVRAVLQKHGFSEISIPTTQFYTGLSTSQFPGEENRADAEERKARQQISELAKNHGAFLAGLEQALRCGLEKAEAPLRLVESENAFVFEGWIPQEKLGLLEKRLYEATDGRIGIEKLRENAENAPIKLAHPKPVGPFEFFINLYSFPKYHEIDPTIFIFLAFPLFYGFMLGDIGYGLVTLALFYGMKFKFKNRRMINSLLNCLILASISTIVFGFVFGEFFGKTVMQPLLSREHDINTMLLISIIVGIIHLNLGFLLGFYNSLAHGLKTAVFENGSWILLEAGIGLMLADTLKIGLAGIGTYAGLAVMITAVAMIYKAHGIAGIIELPGLLSNVLSYSRLFALGLASVSLATIINELAGDLFKAGGAYAVFGVLILVAGHIVNIGLGILGSFLQSMRLHYVEFFTKFYKGGGESYSPFGEH